MFVKLYLRINGGVGVERLRVTLGQKIWRCQIRIGKMPCNLSYQSNFSSGADSEHLSI
ncbi:unknown protein [Microcystis aeruginosa NIES-843]|uniref:Uncharacterized protein n=1 Tax=Microcystis aeruginosa (strain NIES-843 / IAM M-2473) TaxID=449447 RepID=B0JH17_MICAN|nr:unknown protein [Microcystis aeruginosa NIES-843]